MSDKTTENIQLAGGAPVPPTPTPASVETTPTVAAPVESPAEKQDKKVTAAFIAQRQKIRELEAKAKVAPVAPSPATTEPVEAVHTAVAVPQAPAPVIAESGIDAAIEKQALADLANDKELAKVSMGVVEVLEMIDTDPRLVKLYRIDPKLAIREAKSEYMSKLGITSAVPMPVSTAPSGGMGGGGADLEAMYSAIESLKPGTAEWHKLAHKIDAELKRGNP